MRLKDKVAIVTGASRGIGKAIALALAKEGVNVVVAARSEIETRLPGTIHKTVEEIHALNGSAFAVKTDLKRDEDVYNMVKKTIHQFGCIDILINNAGINISGTLMEISIKRWDLIMKINLRGTFLCTKAVLPFMIKQSSGSIINLSSILGTRMISGGVPYGVTKAAIERFTVGLAQEVREYGIAVNALCPSFTNTEGSMVIDPNGDRSTFQRAEIWGRYATFLASQDVSSLTGKCLTARELEELISKS